VGDGQCNKRYRSACAVRGYGIAGTVWNATRMNDMNLCEPFSRSTFASPTRRHCRQSSWRRRTVTTNVVSVVSADEGLKLSVCWRPKMGKCCGEPRMRNFLTRKEWNETFVKMGGTDQSVAAQASAFGSSRRASANCVWERPLVAAVDSICREEFRQVGCTRGIDQYLQSLKDNMPPT
jgi:hypothetical protein